jgi:NAD-dependent SIR2 family protein deacetylase
MTDVMFTSTGWPKKCKIGGCKRQAEHGPWRGQYCSAHGEDVVAKRLAAETRRREAPKCPQCGAPMFIGVDRCSRCAEKRQGRIAADEKRNSFNEAETVEELKDWMNRYMFDYSL